MRVEAGTNLPYASQRAQASAADRSTSASFSAALTAAQTNSAKQTDSTKQVESAKQLDFTSMTRQEMRDWVNAQLRSGEMSFDESLPFMAMTLCIPVPGLGGTLADGLNETLDFMQLAGGGVQRARLHNDETTLKMLEVAMPIMQRHQGTV